MKKQQFYTIIQQIIDYLTGLIPTPPPPPPPPGLGSIIDGNNRLSPASSSDADLIRGLLDSLILDLEKIEKGKNDSMVEKKS